MTTKQKNLLSPNRFRIVIQKFPEVQFQAQRTNLPGFNFAPVQFSTNTNKDAFYPGDKIEYEDLMIGFLVDEQLDVYKVLKDWFNQVTLLDNQKQEFFSDITVEVLTNNHQLNQTLIYENCMPYSVSGGLLDVSIDESTPPTLDCMFKFSKMTVKDNT